MIHHGDCFTVLPTLEAESVDACVTDPPYGIGFMGREWDTFKPGTGQARIVPNRAKESDNPNLKGRTRGPASSPSSVEYDYSVKGLRAFQDWTEQWAREVLRVMKPGGYLLVCGAPRSSHRMACGIEDAGFEIRDTLSWLFGQGFPKSLDVSKAIDRAAGAWRRVVGTYIARGFSEVSPTQDGRNQWAAGDVVDKVGTRTAPSTDAAHQWDGWGTALKPGWEPVVMARKPLRGTVAANVERFGTGAINIDGCRIEGADGDGHWSRDDNSDGTSRPGYEGGFTTGGAKAPAGRWPANVLLDEGAAELLDEQSGELVSGANPTRRGSDKFRGIYSAFPGQTECEAVRGQDVGGASRFFYVAKPSREERDLGCDSLPMRSGGELCDRKDGSAGLNNPRAGAGRSSGGRNTHPTVKPLALMRWLVRLVTPPGGLVLDPFTGSGTTGMACSAENFRFTGIEREAEYVAIAECRIAAIAPLFAERAV